MAEKDFSGEASSSDPSGLGGRDARMTCSSFSMQLTTLRLSVRVIFCTALITLLSGETRSPGGDCEEAEEAGEAEEEGEGVSRAGRAHPASMLGRSVVSMLDTAIRLAGAEARLEWE